MTGVVVSYRAPELIFDAVCSMKRFHRTLPIHIVDGSGRNHECRKTIQMLINKFEGVTAQCHDRNIGHGNGLHAGICQVNAKNVLIFDSDIIVNRPFIADILRFPLFYGVGKIVHVDDKGENVSRGTKYVHPYFSVINRSMYFEHAPFENHGAPLLKAMKSIRDKSLLIDFPVENYVTHLERGTRNLLQGQSRIKPTVNQKQTTRHSVFQVR